MIYNDVIEWVKSLPYWQQEIAKNIIDNKSLNDEFLDSVYHDFKKEVGLDSDKLVAEKIDFSEQNAEEKENDITWMSVNNIKGVNRLKSECALIIGSGLSANTQSHNSKSVLVRVSLYLPLILLKI